MAFSISATSSRCVEKHASETPYTLYIAPPGSNVLGFWDAPEEQILTRVLDSQLVEEPAEAGGWPLAA